MSIVYVQNPLGANLRDLLQKNVFFMNKAEFMRLIFEKVVLSKTVRQEKLCVLVLINA